MGWKKVAVAGCVAPVLGGCNLFHLAGHNVVNEHHVVHTEQSVDRELRRDAKAAWQEVRAQFPRRLFTADFRDGFLDGYADYLARGGNAQPPAVPPLKYVHDKKYFTPEGHCLIRDYYLGFKYGVDVAVASGQRKFLTVPVLLAEKHDGPPTFNIQPGGDHPPAAGVPAPPPPSQPEPLPAPKPLPAPPGTSTDPVPPRVTDPKVADPMTPNGVKLPGPPKAPDGGAKRPDGGAKSSVPWVSPATVPQKPPTGTTVSLTRPPKADPPPQTGGTKFGSPGGDSGGRLPPLRPPMPRRVPADTAAPVTAPVPVPVTPAPAPAAADPIRPTPAPLPKTTDLPGAMQPAPFSVKFPEPPAEVPTLPSHLPTPSVLDELPVLPANHTVPDPLPATSPR